MRSFLVQFIDRFQYDSFQRSFGFSIRPSTSSLSPGYSEAKKNGNWCICRVCCVLPFISSLFVVCIIDYYFHFRLFVVFFLSSYFLTVISLPQGILILVIDKHLFLFFSFSHSLFILFCLHLMLFHITYTYAHTHTISLTNQNRKSHLISIW